MCADTEPQLIFLLASDLRGLLPVAVAAVMVWRSRPRHAGLRWLLAVLLGWAVDATFTDAILDPAGAAKALGDEGTYRSYSQNSFAISLVIGWLFPALAATAALILASVLRRMRAAWARRDERR